MRLEKVAEKGECGAGQGIVGMDQEKKGVPYR